MEALMNSRDDVLSDKSTSRIAYDKSIVGTECFCKFHGLRSGSKARNESPYSEKVALAFLDIFDTHPFVKGS
jgi:hypothetical protein